PSGFRRTPATRTNADARGNSKPRTIDGDRLLIQSWQSSKVRGVGGQSARLSSGAGRLCLRVQDQFLHAPIGSLGRVYFVFRRAGKRVSAGKLPKIASGASDHPKHFAVERNLEDAPRKGTFSNKKDLIGSRRNADGIRLPNDRGQARAGGGGAIDGAGFRIRRHVDGKHAQELALRIEHLNAPIRAIADIQIVAAVG